MPIEHPKYDVAISFLSRDEPKAEAIYWKLSEGLQVFFFPRGQEELVGTDSLESMRKPFFDGSRVMLVLYREAWGKTPWTRVEHAAIKEACRLYGLRRLFFIVLDEETALPLWLPQYFVCFNFEDYGLEQIVGAIKARVQENGGQYLPLTPRKRAEKFKADELFRQDKSRMDSEQGRAAIFNSVVRLFQEIDQQCEIINAQGYLQIRCGADLKIQVCGMTNGAVGLTVSWQQPYPNVLDGSSLLIRQYRGGLILPDEGAGPIDLDPTRLVGEAKYLPDLSLAREYGWRQESMIDFVSSAALGEQCVIQLMNLANRYATGEL
jgi:TIR domain